MGPLVLVVIVMMMVVFVAAGAGLAVVVMVVIVVIVTAGAGLRPGGFGHDFGGAGFVVGMTAGGHGGYLSFDWSADRGWRGSGLILRRTCLSAEAVPRMYLPSMAVSTSASVWL